MVTFLAKDYRHWLLQNNPFFPEEKVNYLFKGKSINCFNLDNLIVCVFVIIPLTNQFSFVHAYSTR